VSAKEYFFALRKRGGSSVVQVICEACGVALSAAASQALYRDVGEVRGRDRLLLAICRRGETAEPGDDFDHDGIQSLR